MNEDTNALNEDTERSVSERMRELGRLSGAARRRKKEQRGAGGASRERPQRDSNDSRNRSHTRGESRELVGPVDLHGLSLRELTELLEDPQTPAYVKPRISAELRQLGSVADRESAQAWKTSVQVRPDYTPPTWDEVLEVARKAGAVLIVPPEGVDGDAA
jgi:hypothetical protein